MLVTCYQASDQELIDVLDKLATLDEVPLQSTSSSTPTSFGSKSAELNVIATANVTSGNSIKLPEPVRCIKVYP